MVSLVTRFLRGLSRRHFREDWACVQPLAFRNRPRGRKTDRAHLGPSGYCLFEEVLIGGGRGQRDVSVQRKRHHHGGDGVGQLMAVMCKFSVFFPGGSAQAECTELEFWLEIACPQHITMKLRSFCMQISRGGASYF